MDLSVLDRACQTDRLVGDGLIPSSQTASPTFGINIDYSNVPIYANVLRSGVRYFAPPAQVGSNTNVALDANLCPTVDFGLNLNFIEKVTGPTGDTFAITFRGQATVAAGGGGTVSNYAYNATTNTATATLSIPAGATQCYLFFTNTRRLATDTTATGIDARSLFIMRPIAPGSTAHHATTEKFNRQLLVALAPWKGGYWRDVDCGLINGQPTLPTLTAANRTLPNSPLQIVYGAGNTWGMAYEDRIGLSNFLGMGWWTNFPDTGTTDLFQLILNLVKYGSDSNGNPYTGTAGSNPITPGQEVNPPLAAGLRFLWEEGNENWNGAFAQYGRWFTAANANPALNANNEVTPITGAGITNAFGTNGLTNNLNFCQVAFQLAAHADMAAAQFPGGLGMKYCPMACTQAGPTNSRAAITWLRRHYAARGQALAQNITATGGDSYDQMLANEQAGTVQTVATVLASGVFGNPGVATDGVFATAVGIDYSSYEGGISNYPTTLGIAVDHDPGFRPIVRDRVLNLVACGCRWPTNYALIRGGWSILDSIWDLTHPKWLGWADAIACYPMAGQAPAALPAPPAPFFQDPTFEAYSLVSVSNAADLAYAPAGTPWTFSPKAGVNGQNTGFVNSGQFIPFGTQVGFIQGAGSISQSVPNWAAGSYAISGYMNGRLNQTPVLPFSVLVDGVVVGTLTPPNGAKFTPFATPAFAVAAGTHTVAFAVSSATSPAVLLNAVAIVAAVPATPTTAKPINGGAAGLKSTIGGPAY